jgi:hypothetical protein
VSVHGPPGPFDPLRLLNFTINADLDPAFSSKADPDPVSKKNLDPCGSGSTLDSVIDFKAQTDSVTKMLESSLNPWFLKKKNINRNKN